MVDLGRGFNSETDYGYGVGVMPASYAAFTGINGSIPLFTSSGGPTLEYLEAISTPKTAKSAGITAYLPQVASVDAQTSNPIPTEVESTTAPAQIDLRAIITVIGIAMTLISLYQLFTGGHRNGIQSRRNIHE